MDILGNTSEILDDVDERAVTATETAGELADTGGEITVEELTERVRARVARHLAGRAQLSHLVLPESH